MFPCSISNHFLPFLPEAQASQAGLSNITSNTVSVDGVRISWYIFLPAGSNKNNSNIYVKIESEDQSFMVNL